MKVKKKMTLHSMNLDTEYLEGHSQYFKITEVVFIEYAVKSKLGGFLLKVGFLR